MASESGTSISYNDHVTSSDSHVTKEDDHVTPIHQWQQQQQWEELRYEEESEDDTAGEEGDTLPPDSTSTATTDAVNDPLDPIDFIETHPHDHTHCFNGGGAVRPGTGRSVLPGSQGMHYDGWNILEVMQGDVKKGKPVKRMKAPRAGAKPERLRTPYQLPRVAGKTKYPRPSPSSRKRRLSGRMMRPAQPANASEEGDMAQADEMGEGEGRDDGFVEGVDPISRRRNKKRPGGIHMLLPPPGGGSPPSSPSNTPVTRRRTSSRKSRLKPRSKKQSKPQLASADLSTQESTTQGPGSSESSDEVTSPDGETTPLRTAGEDIPEEEGEESRSLTPNPKDPSTLSSMTHHHNHHKEPPPRPPPPFSSRRLDHVSDIHNHAPNSILGRLASGSKEGLQSNSDDNLVVDSNGTSDTDQHHSLNLPSPGKGERWTSRRFESDLSTAPFSSETSDMDTSGNERVATTDSVVSNSSPPLGKRVQVKSGIAGGRGGVGGSGLRNPARPGSGSSGDERSSKKRQSKKSITIASSSSSSVGISKPLPPPVPKKVPLPAKSEKGQSSGPSGGGAASRRQLQHTKSNPLANHRVVSQSHDSAGTGGGAGSSGKPRSSVTGSPSRSLSTKPNMITRPKPPVGTKPKPAPPPKPTPTKVPSKPPPPKPAANHRAASSTGGSQSTVTKPRSHSHTEGEKLATQVGKGELRKGQSVDSVSEVTVSPPSPPTATRSTKNPPLKKPLKAVGGAEKGKEGPAKQVGGGSSGPTSSSVYSKPSVASKPRRLSSEKRPHLVKSGNTLTKKDIVVVKNFSSPQISDSSKNPSSSEATSGLSQSPTNSPYPSPSLLHKKPSPPSAKPNKPSPMLAKKISSPLLPNAATKPTKTSPKLAKKVSSPVLPTPASKILGGMPSSKSKPEISSSASKSKPELSPPTSKKSKPELSPPTSKKSKPELSPATSRSKAENLPATSKAKPAKSPSASKSKPEAPSKVKPDLSPILLKTKPEVSPPSKTKPAIPSATSGTKKDGKEERDGGEQPVLFSISEGSLSDSITSPSPPPIPARNYLTNSHDSSGLQDDSNLSSPPPIGGLRGTDIAKSPRLQSISSDSTSPSPRPRSRQGGAGPRRPPPVPPATPPLILTGQSALSASSIPTTEFGRRLPPRSKSYDVIEDAGKKTSSTEGYFGSHQSRETVEDVSYAVVKRSSLRRNQQNREESTSSGDTNSHSSKPSSGKEELVNSVGGRNPKPIARRPPPKSPTNVYESIDELRKPLRRQTTDKGHQLLTQKHSFSPPPDDSGVPPPLPSRPAPRLTPNLASTHSSSSPNLLEPASYEGLVLVKENKDAISQPMKSQPMKATRDPVYDVIPDNFKKKPPRPRRNYEEIILPEFDGDVPRIWVPSPSEGETKEKPPPPLPSRSESSSPAPPLPERKEFSPNPPDKRESTAPSITMVTKKEGVVSRLTSTSSETKMLALEDLRENWTAPDALPKERRASGSGTLPEFRKRQAKSFSAKHRQSLMFKRNSSERSGKQKANTFDSATSNKGLMRAGSLDRLNLRMEQSVRNSIHHTGSSSEDEEEATASVSPTTTTEGLPRIPNPNDSSLYKVPKSNKKPAGPFLCPPDVEPLYQYINTAEFLREREPHPQSAGGSSPSEYGPPGGEGGKKQNQLELARQLSMRKLWCELPEVIQSGVLNTLTSEERKLQEAIFEVISSEDSYLRSLDVLINHFMNDPGMNPHLPEGRRVIDKRQHHVIFSNVKEVRDVSGLFLEKLHARQRESAVVKNISDIILDFSDNYFDCYVRYCTNQVYQIREMQDMISNPSNVMFRDYLHRLESDKICQSLNIQSFLLLPMQRITRLPLLILAILNRTPLDHPDHDLVEKTLRSVQKLVTECNDGARKMDRTEQLHEIDKKLDFGKMKPIPIVSLSRQLERRGILVRLQVEQKLLGKAKIKKKPLYLFIFTDYVVITKRKKDPKGDYTYRVKDYASKAVVEVEWLDYHPGVSFPKFGEQNPISKATYAVSTANAKHAFMMVFLDNASHKEGNYIFLAQNDTDKTRWMECLNRPDQKDDEKIYQHWDCPQVQAVYDYKSQQPDELDLDRGDVVKVYRKMADGWYEGERLRDMMWGWFPSNFTVEIENAHTRARNLRQTHKLNCTSSTSALALMQSQP